MAKRTTPSIRIGFIGCGLIANAHARNLGSVPAAAIGPVFDLDRERAERLASASGRHAVAVNDPDAVLADCDAVYVCTWTSAHPDLVVAAAGLGRPVFCEKPLAVDLAGVDRMVEAVTTAGVVNQVGLVLRHSPSFRWLHQLATSTDAGPIMSIVFRDDQYIPTQGLYQSTWRGDRDKAGAGTLLEHSIHDLDLLRWLLGPIRMVSGLMDNVHGLDGIDDVATVTLEAASGAQASLISIWHDVLSRPSQRRVEVFSQRSVLTLSGDWLGPVEHERSDISDRMEGEQLVAAAAAADGLGTNPDADFVAAVLGERPAYPDFSVAAEAHRLADAAYRSAANGGTPIELAG